MGVSSPILFRSCLKGKERRVHEIPSHDTYLMMLEGLGFKPLEA
jgi:hypothetical protein